MEGYDLQDTLVNINYASSFGMSHLVDNIIKAKVLHRPQGKFVIVTAQQDNSQVHTAIKKMVATNFPDCEGVYFVSGGQADVIQKKAASIKRLNLSSFTDNNREILAGIKELVPDVPLYVMTSSGRKRY
jgi:hypothetical protein